MHPGQFKKLVYSSFIILIGAVLKSCLSLVKRIIRCIQIQ